jgi:hypothetical protein
MFTSNGLHGDMPRELALIAGCGYVPLSAVSVASGRFRSVRLDWRLQTALSSLCVTYRLTLVAAGWTIEESGVDSL